MNIKIFELQADLLNALGHTNRLRILQSLKSGEKCSSDIYPVLHLEQSNLSRHLKILQEAGIVSTRKEGLKVYYHIEDDGIFSIVDAVSKLVKNKIKKNVELLQQLK
jgi:DNA-binding transcriptional ArsR family regulator